MGQDPYYVSAIFGIHLQEYSNALGLDFASLCKNTDIRPHQFRSNFERIPCADFADLLERLAEQSGRTDFALNYGLECILGDLGPVVYGLQKSATLRAAIEFFLKFSPLSMDYPKFQVSHANGACIVTWTYSPYIQHDTQFKELQMMIVHRIFSRFVDYDNEVVNIFMTGPTSPNKHFLDVYFKNKVIYDSPCIGVSFFEDALDRKNPDGDSSLALLMRGQCEILLKLLNLNRANSLNVRRKILELLEHEEPSIEVVANRMGLSVRTLQRQLSKSHMSFSQILSETRRDYSSHLMQNPNLTMEDIAFKLGYKAASVYSRAAKDWYGKSASLHRKEVLQSQQLTNYDMRN